MIWLILAVLIMFWLIATEGNIFLKDKDDDNDHYHNSMDL
jgi:hypothetical protein